MRDVETGLTNIDILRGAQHSHEPESELGSQGFPMHKQEMFYDIVKYELRAKPGKLIERLEVEMTRVYKNSEGEAHTESTTPNHLSVFLKGQVKELLRTTLRDLLMRYMNLFKVTKRNEDD